MSYRDLRKVCQLPVRDGNDVAGLLFGDFASLPITKFFVDLKLSPNYASIGFMVAGLVGAALQGFSGVFAFAGAVCLVLYYVLDCVDGEVARFQKVTAVEWGYFDYLSHLFVKPLVFFGVGVGTFLALDQPWLLAAAFTASVATLWLKAFLVVPGLMFLRDALGKFQRTGEPYRGGFAEHVTDEAPAPQPDGPAPNRFQVRPDLVTLRALLTNFDIGLLLLALAAALDLFVEPMALPLVGTLSFRALWLVYYAIVLPLDFLDYLVTYVRRGHFSSEMRRLVALAHRFRAERSRSDAEPR